MFGQAELDRLALKKQALLLESALNRLALQIECRNLRSATAWVSQAARTPRKLAPLLLVLAPLVGLLLARVSRRQDSCFNRAAAAAKCIGPLYTLWKSLTYDRQQAEPGKPAA